MTDRCNAPQLAKLLHHYELGLLSENDRREFELHLYECEACFARVWQFGPAARLMSHDPDVHESVRRMAENQPEKSRRLRIWPKIIPISVAAAAALVLLILRPWHVEIQPTYEAVAQENRLAIMYFDNLVDRDDPEQLGEIAANLLITDLSGSAYFQVVSGQRLYDILKLLGREEQKQIDRDIARQVADTAEADLIILGSILQVDPHFILTVQLIETTTGKVLAAQRVTGEPGEDIFSMVDQLTAQVRNDLALPAAAAEELDRRIAEVTTHSADAYRHFMEGINSYRKYFWTEAASSFSRALEFDSTFAMAYYYLAELVNTELIEKAMDYVDRASQRDRYYIQSRQAAYSQNIPEAIVELQKLLGQYPDEKEALYLLGQYSAQENELHQAVRYLQDALTVDPLYKSAHNYLAYVYDAMDEYEKAIEAINTYISLAPDEPNPYDTRGEIYLKNGRIDQAIESFDQALQIKPDFRNSRWNLARIHFLRQEFSQAESLFQSFTVDNDPGERVCGRFHLALLPLGRGKFVESLQAFDEALSAKTAEESPDQILGFEHFLKARIYAEQKDFAHAITEFDKHMQNLQVFDPQPELFNQNIYAQLLAESGDLTQAEQVARSLKSDEEQISASSAAYWYAVGCIEMAKGNPDSSITCFTKTLVGWTDYPVHFMLARAYLEAGRLAEAVDKFESLLQDYTMWRVFWCIWSVKAHYYLGLAYERSSWFHQAVEQYETFLKIWKDADPGIAEIEDARKRLTRLRASGNI